MVSAGGPPALDPRMFATRRLRFQKHHPVTSPPTDSACLRADHPSYDLLPYTVFENPPVKTTEFGTFEHVPPVRLAWPCKQTLLCSKLQTHCGSGVGPIIFTVFWVFFWGGGCLFCFTIFFLIYFLSFCLFLGPLPAAYGGSQARG